MRGEGGAVGKGSRVSSMSAVRISCGWASFMSVSDLSEAGLALVEGLQSGKQRQRDEYNRSDHVWQIFHDRSIP
jgi:hypothetical protein